MDLSEFETVSRFMERYPDVQLVLTHGLSWRSFADENGIDVPDAVYDALPIDNPNFHVQLLFAIFFGGMYDYPMPQIRPALEKVVERLGANRLMWGTDIPHGDALPDVPPESRLAYPQPRFPRPGGYRPHLRRQHAQLMDVG